MLYYLYKIGSYLSSNAGLDLESLKYVGANMAGSFVEIAQNEKLLSKNAALLNKTLLNFFSELKKTGAEFGYRSASEIMRFAAIVNMIELTWSTTDIIDAAIMQKLLPKVHGSRKKLEGVLLTLARLCVQDAVKNVKEFKVESLLISEDLDTISEKFIYPVSFEKIARMHKGLLANGFTSFAEA
jgi:5-methylcytosine-specific restriction protein B